MFLMFTKAKNYYLIHKELRENGIYYKYREKRYKSDNN